MIRTAGRGFLIGFIILAIFGTAAAAPNRDSGALLPAIVDFYADTSTLNYPDVEAGNTQVTLTWRTLNTNGQYRLALDTLYQNYWVSLLDDSEVLPLSGSRTITVALPHSFGVPTYRLTLKTSRGEFIDQQFITLPYDAMPNALPTIVKFSTQATTIDTNLLVQGNVRLVVSYEVSERMPDTLIRFEQVLPGGQAVDAEGPRGTLWLPAKGEIGLMPRASSSKDDLTFRMTLIGAHDAVLYDQAEFSIPVGGHVVLAPSAPAPSASANNSAAPQTLSAESDTPPLAIQAAGPLDFSAESQVLTPGGDVTLNWNAGDAARVQLLEQRESGPTTLYIELPPAGTLTVPAPQGDTSVTYTLRAQTAEGEVTTGEVTIVPPTTPGG